MGIEPIPGCTPGQQKWNGGPGSTDYDSEWKTKNEEGEKKN